MNLRISGKHMDIGDAFRGSIEERISQALGKYFDGGASGRVTVEKSGSRFSAECFLALDTGMTFQASGQAHDPQAAFDIAAERIEKRLRRYKRRLKSYGGYDKEAAAKEAEALYRVMSAFPEDDDTELPEDYAPAVIAESTMPLRSLSVADAVLELDTKDNPVFAFRNAANDTVNFVYRRPDGNIGWIDPALS